MKILLIDDCRDLLDIMALSLEKQGHVVTTAENGVEAMSLISTEVWPDLIFLDHDMPKMNGPEFLVALAKSAPTFKNPIILLSCRHSPEMDKLPVTEVHLKPMTPELFHSIPLKYVSVTV